MRIPMLVTLTLASLPLVACQTASARSSSTTVAAPSAETDPFPPAKSGIQITIAEGSDMRVDRLLDEFSKATGLTLLVGPETRNVVQKSSTGLNRSVDVPASQVYSVVETILVQNDLVLAPIHTQEPRIVAVYSTREGNRGAKSYAFQIPSGDVQKYAGHPAVVVTTVLELPHTDVRTLSNSMRTMFTDANLQLMIPVGNTNVLIVTGLGSQVASWARMLQEADDASRRAMEEDEKRAAPRKPAESKPAPAEGEKPKQ
jgi:hypothetical protein